MSESPVPSETGTSSRKLLSRREITGPCLASPEAAPRLPLHLQQKDIHMTLSTDMQTRRAGRYGILGRSRAIADVIRLIELVSATRSTVLITGETGTGKELVARAVHERSAQHHMPFIKINCAAIPETLLESELFGHV